MTKEELKQKAEAETDKVIIGSGMDRASVIHLKHLLVTMYIQGAEPREKRIAELEQENKEVHINWLKVIQENTELKEKLEIEKNARGDWFGKAVTKDRQLTEAKELLKDITSSYGSTEVSEAQLYLKIKKAEQFISEVDK